MNLLIRWGRGPCSGYAEGCLLVGHSLSGSDDAATVRHAVDLVQRGGEDVVRLNAFLEDEQAALPEPPRALGGGYRDLKWGSSRDALEQALGKKSRAAGQGRRRIDLEGGGRLTAHFDGSELAAVELRPKLKSVTESQKVIDELFAKYGKPLSSVEMRGQQKYTGYPTFIKSYVWTDGETRIRYLEEEWILGENWRSWEREPTITYSHVNWGREKSLQVIRAQLAKLQEKASREANRMKTAAEHL